MFKTICAVVQTIFKLPNIFAESWEEARPKNPTNPDGSKKSLSQKYRERVEEVKQQRRARRAAADPANKS